MCGASGGASRAACPKKESTVCVVPSGVVGGGAWDVDSWGGADMVGYERPKVGEARSREKGSPRLSAHALQSRYKYGATLYKQNRQL